MIYNLLAEFVWDQQKDLANYAKHKVKFSEAVTSWQDHYAVEFYDQEHSSNEDRWIRLGISAKSRLLLVVYKYESEDRVIRIISARLANKRYENFYVEGAL